MRRTAILLALVLSGALVAGCGKGGYTTTASPQSKTATASAGAAARPATKAHALAFARAVNLTTADVPGFTASPRQHNGSAAERKLEHEFQRCSGAQATQSGIAEAGSPDFELKRGIIDLSANSEVSVARSSAEAAKTLSAIRSPHVHACLTRYLGQLLKSQSYAGAKVTGISIKTGTPPAPGTTGGFGWRITAKLAVHGIDVSFYLDILGFVDGPSQVTLTSSGALRPFPAAAQEHLFSLLLERAKAHHL